MLVSATKSAPLGSFPVRVIATGEIAGKPVTVTATPLSGAAAVRQGYLTVLEAAPFTLELATLNASLEQGQSATLEVLAQRAPGFTGEIKLSTEGFNAAGEAISKSFEGGEATMKASSAKITLKPKLDSELGTRTIVVRGDAAGISQYSHPMPVTVTQYPLQLSSTLGKLSVTALPAGSSSAAGETETKIKVERRAGFAGDVELSIEGLPPGIKSELGKLTAGLSEVTLKITATEKAPITNATCTVLGTAVFNDRNYKTRTGPITLVVSAPEQIEIATNAPPAVATPPAGTK
jgi:hypothetical protein